MKQDHGGACRPGQPTRIMVLRRLRGRQGLLHQVSVGLRPRPLRSGPVRSGTVPVPPS